MHGKRGMQQESNTQQGRTISRFVLITIGILLTNVELVRATDCDNDGEIAEECIPKDTSEAIYERGPDTGGPGQARGDLVYEAPSGTERVITFHSDTILQTPGKHTPVEEFRSKTEDGRILEKLNFDTLDLTEVHPDDETLVIDVHILDSEENGSE